MDRERTGERERKGILCVWCAPAPQCAPIASNWMLSRSFHGILYLWINVPPMRATTHTISVPLELSLATPSSNGIYPYSESLFFSSLYSLWFASRNYVFRFSFCLFWSRWFGWLAVDMHPTTTESNEFSWMIDVDLSIVFFLLFSFVILKSICHQSTRWIVVDFYFIYKIETSNIRSERPATTTKNGSRGGGIVKVRKRFIEHRFPCFVYKI